MAIIALPSPAKIRSIDWSLERPAQLNRSQWTGRDQVVVDPWHARWSAEAELAPLVGEVNVLAWRAFLAKLKGRINTFRLPATERAQHESSAASVITNSANTAVTAQGGGVYRVVKNGGGSVYNAAAVSTTLTGDFLLKLDFISSMDGSYAGMSSNPTANTGAGINYAFLLSSGQITIWESGANTGVTAFAPTTLWLRRVGTTLTYESGTDPNALTVRRTVAGVSAALGFDSALFVVGATFDALLTSSVLPTVASGGAAGATTLTLSTAVPLVAGHMATIPLTGGGEQLVQLTENISGGNVITFEPKLRQAAAVGSAVNTSRPTALVALASATTGWSVSPGQIYGIRLSVEERF